MNMRQSKVKRRTSREGISLFVGMSERDWTSTINLLGTTLPGNALSPIGTGSVAKTEPKTKENVKSRDQAEDFISGAKKLTRTFSFDYICRN